MMLQGIIIVTVILTVELVITTDALCISLDPMVSLVKMSTTSIQKAGDYKSVVLLCMHNHIYLYKV